MPTGDQGRNETNNVPLPQRQAQESPGTSSVTARSIESATSETAILNLLLPSTRPCSPYSAPVAVDDLGNQLFLDESRPFTMLCLGKPGSGKSNTQSVILENHILRRENKKPFGAIVFRFADTVTTGANEHIFGLIDTMPEEAVVLVSPVNKSSFQTGVVTQKIKLNWAQLSARAQHLKALMRIDKESPPRPLYTASIENALRRCAAAGDEAPSFGAFKNELFAHDLTQEERLSATQLVETFLASEEEPFVDFGKLLEKYRLIVVDLADPLLSEYDASAIISVLLSLFRSAPLPMRLAGKMVVFDGAHKFFVGAQSPLCKEVVGLCEDICQENTRVLVTSEALTAIPREVFRLSTFAVIHHLHAPSDWEALQEEYCFSKTNDCNELSDIFASIRSFKPGKALIVSSSMAGVGEEPNLRYILVTLRPCGASENADL